MASKEKESVHVIITWPSGTLGSHGCIFDPFRIQRRKHGEQVIERNVIWYNGNITSVALRQYVEQHAAMARENTKVNQLSIGAQ